MFHYTNYMYQLQLLDKNLSCLKPSCGLARACTCSTLTAVRQFGAPNILCIPEHG